MLTIHAIKKCKLFKCKLFKCKLFKRKLFYVDQRIW